MNTRPAFSFLLILLYCLAGFYSNAQKCNCPEYIPAREEQQKTGGDKNNYHKKLESLGNTICTAKSYEWAADDFTDENRLDTAEALLLKAEKLLQQTHCGDSILLNTYKLLASIYYSRGDFGTAQSYAFKLLRSCEAAGDPYETGVCYTMIAQLLNQTGQAEKGIVYARMAVPLLKKISNTSHYGDLLFKISKRYLWHYQDTKTVSSLDSSELFSLQQLEAVKKIGKRSSIAAAFSNLEGVAYERHDNARALEYIDSSLSYLDSLDYGSLATNYYDKADIFIELKRFDEATRMADAAMYCYVKMGAVAYIAEAYELMARIAVEKGDYKKAFETMELSRDITDSIRNVEKTKQVAELEKKYTQAKNEKKIQDLAQQKKTYLLLAVAGLLLLVALGFFIRQQSLKNKQKILETEQRLNRARMNPHFFFNALSSLQSFALEGNDGKSIAGNLSRFSHIMRETLESTYKEYVTVEQETDFLREYLELQQMRFPQKFSYEITMNGDMEPDELIIPSMILQPFIENSIEHGFSGITYPGRVTVGFNISGKDLLVTIADNGKGLAGAEKENSGHISRASQIIRDRIYLLNIKLKTRAGFSIENNSDGKGVLVKVTLPVMYKNQAG